VAPTTSGWRLASYASLLSACFLGTTQVQFAPFSVRLWKDGLSFCPVETVSVILQGRGCLRLTQNAIFFSWMRLRCLFLSLSSWHPGDSPGLVAASAALVRGAPLGAVPRLGGRGSARLRPSCFPFLLCPMRFDWES
jgi:hypothetical protein